MPRGCYSKEKETERNEREGVVKKVGDKRVSVVGRRVCRSRRVDECEKVREMIKRESEV